MSIKKNLDPSDKSFTSFTVNKKFSFTERDSGSGIFAVPIIRGTDANLYNFLKSTATSKPYRVVCFIKHQLIMLSTNYIIKTFEAC